MIEESFEGDEFEVRYGPRFEGESQNWWLVSLPHQCGPWLISAKLHKEDTVKDLELFISKARTALEELKKMTVAGDASADYSWKLSLNPGSSVDHTRECPECGSPILIKWSGVECASTTCDWWFCH